MKEVVQKGLNLKNILHNYEKKILAEVLVENDFNISKSARYLGISRQNLQHKIKLYSIKVDSLTVEEHIK